MFSNAIREGRGVVDMILGERYAGTHPRGASVLSELGDEVVLNWCRENPDFAPAFAIGSRPHVESIDNVECWTPLTQALIDEFGHDEDVLDSLTIAMHSYSWTGSLVPYYERYLTCVGTLSSHSSQAVRAWSTRTLAWLRRSIETEQVRDAERELR